MFQSQRKDRWDPEAQGPVHFSLLFVPTTVETKSTFSRDYGRNLLY